MKDYIETQYKNLDFTIPDDYVSRREVYAMLDYIGGADADEAYFQGWDAAIDEACSLLNDVDSAMRWTPVAEEPPEESGTLLVTRYNKLTGFRILIVRTVSTNITFNSATVSARKNVPNKSQRKCGYCCDWSSCMICSVRTTSRIGGAEKRRIAFIMTTVVAAGLLMAGMIAIAVLMVLILTPSKTPKK